MEEQVRARGGPGTGTGTAGVHTGHSLSTVRVAWRSAEGLWHTSAGCSRAGAVRSHAFIQTFLSVCSVPDAVKLSIFSACERDPVACGDRVTAGRDLCSPVPDDMAHGSGKETLQNRGK